MSKVKYETTIGHYDEDVRLDVSLSVDRGVEKEDYEILRNAFNTIEDMAYKYQDLLAKPVKPNTKDK